MSPVLFISDLHLSADRPDTNEAFFAFLERTASTAGSLYILGDLFEYWIGDDDLADPFSASVCAALRRLSESGVALHVMHGNRDFLLGHDFAAAAGARMLADPIVLDLHGTPTLLTHGDQFCTADLEYQAFRRQMRSPAFQAGLLAKPLAERKAIANAARAASETSKQSKSMEIMDVTPEAVEEAFRAHGVSRMIHGHTHRPARHVHGVDGRDCERWVLHDWYGRGAYLRCDANGCESVTL